MSTDRSLIQAARFKSHRATKLGKHLRAKQTPAERELWSALRHVAFAGTHFRRQAPLGNYVVDLVCHRAKLVIEVDGGAHNAPDVKARDAERQAWLESRGYRVLRFTNSEIENGVDAVVARITAYVDANTPTPDPAPQGGGERG